METLKENLKILDNESIFSVLLKQLHSIKQDNKVKSVNIFKNNSLLVEYFLLKSVEKN